MGLRAKSFEAQRKQVSDWVMSKGLEESSTWRNPWLVLAQGNTFHSQNGMVLFMNATVCYAIDRCTSYKLSLTRKNCQSRWIMQMFDEILRAVWHVLQGVLWRCLHRILQQSLIYCCPRGNWASSATRHLQDEVWKRCCSFVPDFYGVPHVLPVQHCQTIRYYTSTSLGWFLALNVMLGDHLIAKPPPFFFTRKAPHWQYDRSDG